MRRSISALLALPWLLVMRSDSQAARDHQRAAAELASAQLAAWFGLRLPAPAAHVAGPWLLSVFDVTSETAIVRSAVDQYTRDLSADRTVADELATYLTNRIVEEVFQRQTGSTSGAGFLIVRFAGGTIPYAVRSIRLERAQLGATPVFASLERAIGWPSFETVLQAWYARYAHARASTADLAAVASDVTGQDLGWIFDRFESAARDYAVLRVSETAAPLGRYHSSIVVGRRNASGVDPTVFRSNDSGRLPPIKVVATFADGSSAIERWDGIGAEEPIVYESASPIVSVAVDPEGAVGGDRWRTNNSWAREPKTGMAAVKWSGTWMLWLEHALLGFAFWA